MYLQHFTTKKKRFCIARSMCQQTPSGWSWCCGTNWNAPEFAWVWRRSTIVWLFLRRKPAIWTGWSISAENRTHLNGLPIKWSRALCFDLFWLSHQLAYVVHAGPFMETSRFLTCSLTRGHNGSQRFRKLSSFSVFSDFSPFCLFWFASSSHFSRACWGVGIHFTFSTPHPCSLEPLNLWGKRLKATEKNTKKSKLIVLSLKETFHHRGNASRYWTVLNGGTGQYWMIAMITM